MDEVFYELGLNLVEILYFFNMSSNDEGVDDDADCANGACKRAEIFGVEEVVSFKVSSTNDDLFCSLLSNLSFFTSISFFCIALVGLFRTGAGKGRKFFCLKTSLIFPCLHPRWRTRLCFCLKTE